MVTATSGFGGASKAQQKKYPSAYCRNYKINLCAMQIDFEKNKINNKTTF
jgi:hypothetical protein